ncbi:MAG: haloacid dehalogenase type II [Armatimonadota bacterium]|nr:haloacid dehalogenase type II [Armatimonadota bacterium]MDR7468397.1 haloacid dehalogenase type II [Armatimonadota bacterium]MDR7494986.1 haloacid dehalogenase type II [Armatimonadota bacterium]MDR7548029.1 haloacid dehalogenase type II [Armatimonadota bacterium]MDR7559564.1 haloacid dehalogenase type II [Armatimonadota bacterium]
MSGSVLIFDVNETLLDLRAMDPLFLQVFGDAAVRPQWFQQFVQNFLVTIVVGPYTDFGTIGRGALDMVAQRLGRSLGEEDRRRILGAIRELPPHPEVHESLERLRSAGFRLGTLTNSTRAVAEAQMRSSGLVGLFEQILSAEEVRRLKPAPEPYRMAAERFGVAVGQVRLVAAHAWDVAGALRAGCKAAFVARSGMVLDPIQPAPDIVGRDLAEVAAGIIATDAPA